MFQKPVFRSYFKGAICLLFFSGCFLLQPDLVSGQPNDIRQQGDTESWKNPADTVKVFYEQHLGLLSDSDQISRARLGSLKILVALVDAGNLSEKEQIEKIFLELVNLVTTPNQEQDPDLIADVRKLREQALNHLPLLTAKWAEHENTAYKSMVDALTIYSSELPSQYQKSWVVTKTLGSVLKAESFELKDGEANDAKPNNRRRLFQQASRGLNEIALDPAQDLQVRYNAVNGLITKGDEFLKDPASAGADYTFQPKADVTSFYILVDRLNEIATSDNLPPLLLRQSSAALKQYLNVKLPKEPAEG